MATDLKNRVFSFNLLFRGIENNRPSEDDLWQECVILIFSKTEKEATRKAKKTGREMETTYKTVEGEMLSWKFIQIERMLEVTNFQLIDGVEVFSRFLKNTEVESILKPFDD